MATEIDAILDDLALDAAAEKLKKEDYVLIGLRRGLGTPASLWSQSNAELQIKIKKVDDAEYQHIIAQRILREKYLQHKDALIEAAKQLGISYSNRTRGGIIDEIIAKDGFAPKITLDADQSALITRWDEKLLYISAGPGAGKTLSLCALVEEIMKHIPDARILLLAYNIEAEHTLITRLRRFNVAVQNKRELITTKGCFVVTFDKYLYWARPQQPDLDDVYDAEPVARKVEPTGFRQSFESALTRPMDENESWDWIILDEAQDVQINHACLIDQLRSHTSHFVAAGDPRQSLYSGATWFAREWASQRDVRHTLRFNHRSSRAIVDFLNRYSQKHFPSLHHEQISVRDLDGSVDAVITGIDGANEWVENRQRMGATVANYMHLAQPGRTYAIAPVTIKKYRTEEIVNTARQVLYELQPFSLTRALNEDDKYVLDTSSFIIANAYRIKGTERQRVIVFQIDPPYTSYGIKLDEYLMLLFVSISRAQDHLHMILNRAVTPIDALYGLINTTLCTEVTKTVPPRPYLPQISVTDLAKLDCWPSHTPINFMQHEPVQIDIGADADFVGLYVEACLATACGIILKNPKALRRAECDKHTRVILEPCGIFSAGADYEAVVDPCTWDQCQESFDALVATFASHPEYAFAAMKFTIQTRRPWTVSERFKDRVRLLLDPIVHKWLGTTCIHSQLAKMHINAHRGRDTRKSAIVGIYDFSTSVAIVELKHAIPHTSHMNQAAIYAAMNGISSTLLLNTKIGSAEIIQAFNPKYVHDIAHAFLVLQYSTQCAIRCPSRIPHSLLATVYIAFDIETDGGSNITEIGAVAFTPGGIGIIGVYHQVAAGVINSTGAGIWDTGLAISSSKDLCDDQDRMIIAFHAWAASVTSRCVGLHWGGSEWRYMPSGVIDVIDVSERFRTWLHYKGTPRSKNLALSDAVSEVILPLLKEGICIPHRAFEDALMTASVFNVICNTSGIL